MHWLRFYRVSSMQTEAKKVPSWDQFNDEIAMQQNHIFRFWIDDYFGGITAKFFLFFTHAGS
ncbi:MAG: hypothetical protein PWQ55_2725 [Chloroflexota bacterium]|nr:hypothetical protein [Chloroflexota bacterium]